MVDYKQVLMLPISLSQKYVQETHHIVGSQIMGAFLLQNDFQLTGILGATDGHTCNVLYNTCFLETIKLSGEKIDPEHKHRECFSQSFHFLRCVKIKTENTSWFLLSIILYQDLSLLRTWSVRI